MSTEREQQPGEGLLPFPLAGDKWTYEIANRRIRPILSHTPLYAYVECLTEIWAGEARKVGMHFRFLDL